MTTKALIKQLETSLDGQPWLGNSIMDVLQQVSNPNASLPAGNSIGQILEHLINWRAYAVQKLKGDQELVITLNSPEDWPSAKTYTLVEWEALCKRLQQLQVELLALLNRQDDQWLTTLLPPADKYTYGELIEGIVQHDLYHLGQIALLNRLQAI